MEILAFAFVHRDGVAPAAAQPGTETFGVGVRLTDPAAHASTLRAVEDALPPGSVDAALDHETLAATVDRMQRIQTAFLGAFGLVAAVAAGFLIANAVNQAVRGQVRRIGLLKAVGFTRGQVAATYLTQYPGTALVAGIAGVLVGLPLATMSLSEVAARFGERAGRPSLWLVGGLLVAVVAIAGLSTALPVRRATRVDVGHALRSVGPENERRPARLAWSGASFALAAVDLRARPVRAALTVGGLALAAVTLVFAATIVRSLDEVARDPRSGVVPAADLVVERPETAADEEVRSLLATEVDVLAVRAERWVSWVSPDDGARQGAVAVDGDLARFADPILEGRAPRRPGEAMVGYGVARKHGLTPGDPYVVEIAGQTVQLRITGTYRQLHVGLVFHAGTLAPIGVETPSVVALVGALLPARRAARRSVADARRSA